jgi:hypothetical protein
MKNIKKDYYIIWDYAMDSPLEDLECFYHYTTVIEFVNTGFVLNDTQEWMCLTHVPLVWRKKISEAIEKSK